MVTTFGARRSLLHAISAIALVASVLFLANRSATGSTPEAKATPMAEATVDDVTVRLLSWQQSDTFTAEIELVSASAESITVPTNLMQLTASLPDGSQAILAVQSSTPTSCSLPPGSSGRMTLVFGSADGQTPLSLRIGIEGQTRTGAHVIFPLNSNDGASAVGGNGISGGNAAVTVTSATPGATEAMATPDTVGSPIPYASECSN